MGGNAKKTFCSSTGFVSDTLRNHSACHVHIFHLVHWDTNSLQLLGHRGSQGKWQEMSHDTSLFSSLSLSYSSDSSFILNLGDFEGTVPATSLASGSSGFGADSKA